jgi:excisionase family DNA binding protein
MCASFDRHPQRPFTSALPAATSILMKREPNRITETMTMTRAECHAELPESHRAQHLQFGDRTGFRIGEFVKMTGTSRPTVQRMLARGNVKTIMIGTVRLIPRSEMVRLGLLAI